MSDSSIQSKFKTQH